MNVLVTGGAGFIGSHAALRLLELGHAVTILDDLSRGHREVVDVLAPLGDLKFIHADLADIDVVRAALRDRRIDTVMHFAGLCYVGESVDEPLVYYRQNVVTSVALLQAMQEADVHRLIFSSSCTTYGEPERASIPIVETCPQRPISPYGRTKWLIEQMIRDTAVAHRRADRPFAWVALRYFNVAGSDEQGRLGEDHDPESHLIPICIEAALGQRREVTIFGSDFDTPDGTCIRDYTHVQDIVDAHVLVMEALKPGDERVYNVGTGHGCSVRQVIEAVARITGRPVPTVVGPRRDGDPPVLFADPSRLQRELGWKASRPDLSSMIQSAWQWRQAHPHGFAG